MLKQYYAPTPAKMRKIGDAMLWICVGMQPLIASSPMTDGQQKWVMFGLSAAGVVAKAITNLFTEDTTIQTP